MRSVKGVVVHDGIKVAPEFAVQYNDLVARGCVCFVLLEGGKMEITALYARSRRT